MSYTFARDPDAEPIKRWSIDRAAKRLANKPGHEREAVALMATARGLTAEGFGKKAERHRRERKKLLSELKGKP